MARETQDGIIDINDFGFHSDPVMLGDISDFDLHEILRGITVKIDNFTNRGSGWSVLNVTKCVISTAQYNPIAGGSSFIPTPPELVRRYAVVNVRNDDQRCFLWSLLSALHPATTHTHHLYNYKPYINTLDTSSLKYPVTLPMIRQFERLNTHLTINVYTYHENDNIPVYITKHALR